MQVALLYRVAGCLSRKKAEEMINIGLKMLWMSDVHQTLADQFVLRVTNELAEPLIHPQPAAIGRDMGYADCCLLECSFQLFLTFSQTPGHFLRQLHGSHSSCAGSAGEVE